MLRTRLLVAGLMVVAAGCSSSDITGTTADEAVITADVANAAADGVAEDVDMMSGMDGNIGNLSLGVSGVDLGPGDWRPGLTGCTFASGSFTCPPVTRNGLTVTRTITLKDASGATQSAYDANTTASIHIVADISGSVTHGPWSGSVTRHRDFTISGLAGTETSRTVNGTGNETVTNSRVVDTTTRSYNLTGSSTVSDVVLPVRSTDGGNNWPTSGTITRTFTVTITSGPRAGETRTRTVTVTFNGTSTATATANGNTFTIDLAAHTSTRHP